MDDEQAQAVVWTPRASLLKRVAPPLFVAAATVVMFARTLRYGLYWDDQHHARPWAWHDVAGTFVGPFDPLGIEPNYYRPLTVVTFALDWNIFGYAAWGYHLTNVLLHAVAATLVYALVRSVTGNVVVGTIAGLYFAVIPANAAAAIYISERSDILVVIFVVAGMLALRRYHGDRQVWWLAVVCMCCALALLSKEVGAAFVPLAALRWWSLRLADVAPPPPGTAESWSMHWREELRAFGRALGRRPRLDWCWILGPLLALLAVYAVVRTAVLPSGSLGTRYSTSRGPVRGFASAVWATAKAVPWEVSGRAVIVLLLAALVALVLRPTSPSWRVVAFGVAWVLIACVPLANLGQVEPRLLYLAEAGAALSVAGLVGVYVEIVVALRRSPTRRRVPVMGGAALLGVAFVVSTAISSVRSQNQFEPGSIKMLSGDLHVWEVADQRDLYPARYVEAIRARLLAAGLIDEDGNVRPT